MKKTAAILAIGDVRWEHSGSDRTLGGSAAAFAVRLSALNRTVEIAGVVGRDDAGDEALRLLEGCGVGVSLVQRRADLPTETHSVDQPTPRPLSAELLPQHELLERAEAFEVLYFSSRLQEFPTSGDTLRAFLAASPPSFKVYDVSCAGGVPKLASLEQGLEVASVIHLRRSELADVCSVLGLPVMEPGLVSAAIPERFGVSYCIITDPHEGVVVTSIVGEQVSVAPHLSHVVDLLGWEEAFLAAFVHHAMKGSSLERCCLAGMHYADLSASGKGALHSCSKEDLAAIGE
jgi:fructokinase